jgi:hypothetical protein
VTTPLGPWAQESWRAQIQNKRPDVAAFGTICVLDSILDPSGNSYRCPDRAHLKWAAHGYECDVLPEDSEGVEVFAVRRDERGLFLLSALDSFPRQPILDDNGDYALTYRVFARDFPLLEFHLDSAFAVAADCGWRLLDTPN